MAGKFGKQLNLADWWLDNPNAKLINPLTTNENYSRH